MGMADQYCCGILYSLQKKLGQEVFPGVRCFQHPADYILEIYSTAFKYFPASNFMPFDFQEFNFYLREKVLR